MRSSPLERFHNHFGLKKIARCGFSWEKTTKGFFASVYAYCETALIVASIAALLTFAASASAQAQGSAAKDSGQSIPDAPAPQPQKKPAPKPQPPPDAPSQPAQSADEPAPKQPAAKDENAFPEAVSRDAAKAASDAAGSSKPSTPNDNPFPEAVSREAAKAAGNDQAPPTTSKNDLPPGVSSSQSGGALGDAGPPGAPAQPDPPRAKKDAEVGEFYLKKGDYQGALMRYQDATASDPTNVDAIFGMAEAQQMLKKNAEAARNYQLYLDIVPNGPKAKQAMKALRTLQAGK